MVTSYSFENTAFMYKYCVSDRNTTASRVNSKYTCFHFISTELQLMLARSAHMRIHYLMSYVFYYSVYP